MAYRFSTLSPNGEDVYNIDYTVGLPKASNWKPDVMLVQALLNLLFFDNGGTFLDRNWSARGIDPPSNAAPLKMDGLIGPLTQKLIDTYQVGLQQFADYPADGRLDPIIWAGGNSQPTRGLGFASLDATARRSDLANSTRLHREMLTDKKYGELRGYLLYRKQTARQWTASKPTPHKPVFNP